jgi:glycosyltransferase involved in cell wall biosynthesis
LKIVHLVTSTTGGAAQAAIRLHEALLETNYDSRIFSVQRRVGGKSTSIVEEMRINPAKKIFSSATTATQRIFIQNGSNPVSPISLDLLDWDDKELNSADVIHLHAFYNLVSIRSFLTKHPQKKKIVTLHDERFYTGGCHQSFDCEQVATGCQNCPQVHLPFRKLIEKQRSKVLDLIQNNHNVVFICPSMWILKRAVEAFPELPIENFIQIYNPIPRNVVVPEPGFNTRTSINFGFVSQNLDNPIKNLDLLLKAFEEISKHDPNRYSLTLVGDSVRDYSKDNPDVIQKSASSSFELQKILSSLDVLVVPSIHDNLPNVMGEALMSGLALIGSNTGGIVEIVTLFDQKSFRSGDEKELSQAMRSFELHDRKLLQRRAENVFGYKEIATKMMQVYSTLRP